uniref:Metalloendopeptidase n=1 Tax=Strongyloides stercoralis TaxID=6248 RepID=A0A0K0EBH4_STRER
MKYFVGTIKYLIYFYLFHLSCTEIISQSNDVLKRVKRVSYRDNSKIEWQYDVGNYYNDPDQRRVTPNILMALGNISENSCMKFFQTNYILRPKNNLIVSLVEDSFDIPPRRPFVITPFYLNNTCSNDPICIFSKLMYYYGVGPESNRFDRDDYIIIKEANFINESYCERSFQKREIWETMVSDYDFGSFFHAQRNECSNGRKKLTISAKNELYDKMIGQRFRPSYNDWRAFNDLYCRNYCNEAINCEYDSYPNYNKCDGTCVCPNGFTGKNCASLTPSESSCGETRLNATTEKKSLIIHGIKNCTFLITAPPYKKIKLYFREIHTKQEKICFEQMGLEIKYLADKGTTGLCLCGIYKHVALKSSNNEVLIQYIGKFDKHRFSLNYYVTNAKM